MTTANDLIPIVTEAADLLLDVYSPDARPEGRTDMFAAAERNEKLVLDSLRPALVRLRPSARWLADELETTPLPPGEFWVVDAVEGNVNHVHGMPEWCVTVTLIIDSEPVLTVIRQPIGDHTYTATRGEGAFHNGERLRVSAKTDLDAAIVSTGQAETGQPHTHRRIGASITAMLDSALVVRAFVPSTFPMLLLAAGQHDVFWQYEPVLPGIAPGLLLVTEAGGVATRIDGSPWRPGASDVLVAAPGLHRAAVDVLSAVA